MGEGASQTRQSGRERVQTPKARERSMGQLRAGSSDTEDIIEVIDSVPAAPQTKRTEINGHLRDRIVATKVRWPPKQSALQHQPRTIRHRKGG